MRGELREERIGAHMRELAHRAKNLLAVVQAIARQTAPHTQTIGDYVARLAARVQGLAHTHDLIADENWQGVTLDDLATRHLAPFVDEEKKRVRCDGPQLVLSPVAAQNIGLALHELATNAVKHGALSVSQGKIDLAWHHTPPRLHIVWRERDGPPVTAPSRKGFGHVVLARLTPEALDGQATLAFPSRRPQLEAGHPRDLRALNTKPYPWEFQPWTAVNDSPLPSEQLAPTANE